MKVLVEARKNFYKKISEEKKHEKRLKFGQYMSKTVLPSFILIFSCLYWGYGLGHYWGWIKESDLD